MDFMNNFVNVVCRILRIPEYSKYFTIYAQCRPDFLRHWTVLYRRLQPGGGSIRMAIIHNSRKAKRSLSSQNTCQIHQSYTPLARTHPN